MDLTGVTWRKSHRSNGSGGDCVEATKLVDGDRAVRDSKDPAGPVLTCTPAQWAAFTPTSATAGPADPRDRGATRRRRRASRR